MPLSDYIQAPANNTHPSYKKAFFAIGRAPEYATGEVIIASLYREVGYKELSEKKVPSHGTKFFNRVKSPPKMLMHRDDMISSKAWYSIINQVLKSPKQPNQSKKRFLQITPLVPEASFYTSAARLKGNPWNPGALIKIILAYGLDDPDQAASLWNHIFEKLSVDSTDDVWARYIAREIECWRPSGVDYNWELNPYNDLVNLETDVRQVTYPAKQFVKDLRCILDLKEALDRRQWISLVESILRIGITSHVIWICSVQDKIWKAMDDALQGKTFSKGDLVKYLSIPSRGYWVHGAKAEAYIKENARNYYLARLGINLMMHALEDAGETGLTGSFRSLHSTCELLNRISAMASKIDRPKIREKFSLLVDREPRHLSCAKGIPANIFEFLSYTLRQRRTADEELRSYDQGYYMRKSGLYSAAPWIVSLGPASVISLAHCCTSTSRMPKTVVDFCDHLSGYGIFVQANDVPSNELGQTLRNLGLIVDSPDAEGGMVIVPPFQMIEQ